MALVKHIYKGETFKVAKSLTADERDSACATLIRYRDSQANGFREDSLPFESRSETPPKKRGRPRKVIAPSVDSDTGETVTTVADSPLYAQGFYREPCKVCGKGIERTGKRGRAPSFHNECRPTEG